MGKSISGRVLRLEEWGLLEDPEGSGGWKQDRSGEKWVKLEL